MMARTWTVVAWGSLVCAGCPAGDDGDGTTVGVTMSAGSSESGDDEESDVTTDTSTTNISVSSSFGSSGESGSSGATLSGSTTMPEDSSSGDPLACNPVIPGEWNSCHDDMGNVDTTLCNWMGDPDANGFIGCLVSSDMPENSTCFISGCIDACDCFAPPATGTAVVECGEILEAGGTGCHLNCGDGGSCPDGMTCLGTSCFWPPAM